MADESSKQALIAELSSARVQLAEHGAGLRRGLSPTEIAKRNLRLHPVACYGGALVIGLMAARMLTRRRPTPQAAPMVPSTPTEKAGKAAVGLTVLKFAFDFARPALLRWITSHLAARYAPPQRQD